MRGGGEAGWGVGGVGCVGGGHQLLHSLISHSSIFERQSKRHTGSYGAPNCSVLSIKDGAIISQTDSGIGIQDQLYVMPNTSLCLIAFQVPLRISQPEGASKDSSPLYRTAWRP